MKAIIMAGGEGSRLRPLTLDTPKPLVPLCGRPVLGYILALLRAHGIMDCAVTVRYLQSRIEEYLRENIPEGMQAVLVSEAVPLGTAGGVKNACADTDKEVLVLSGDALCDVDLGAAIDRHHESGAAVTIVGKRVEDPREYGLVLSDENGFVKGFVEKPPYSQAVTDLANTGIYILGKRALDMIPKGQPYDFACDLFGQLLSQGERLAVYETDGYWCDIGDTDSYMQCQYDILQGRVRLEGGMKPGSIRPQGRYEAAGEIYFGAGAAVGEGAVISGPCVVGEGAVIGAGAVVEGGVLLKNARIGERAKLEGALLCRGAAIKAGGHAAPGSVVGPDGVIGRDARLLPGRRVWPGRRVADGVIQAGDLIGQSGKETFFDDEGLTGEIGVELTPELLARLGCAVGTLAQRGAVAVACCEGKGMAALKGALAAGILSTGSRVLDFGCVWRSLFDFSASFTACPLGVYLAPGTVQVVEDGALGCCRSTERKLETLLSRGEFLRAPAEGYGEAMEMQGIQALYCCELLRHAPLGLHGFCARVKSANRQLETLLRGTLERLGCDTGSGPLLTVDPSGRSLKIEDGEAGELGEEHLLALTALTEFLDQHDIAVSSDAPYILEEMAKEYHCKVYRYYACPVGQVDGEARTLAASQPYLRDALMMAVRLLGRCKRSGRTLIELARQLPPFETARSELQTEYSPARLMGSFLKECGGEAAEGIRVAHPLGMALVRPSKRGDRIRVFAQSVSAEASRELCEDILERLRRLQETQGLTEK